MINMVMNTFLQISSESLVEGIYQGDLCVSNDSLRTQESLHRLLPDCTMEANWHGGATSSSMYSEESVQNWCKQSPAWYMHFSSALHCWSSGSRHWPPWWSLMKKVLDKDTLEPQEWLTWATYHTMYQCYRSSWCSFNHVSYMLSIFALSFSSWQWYGKAWRSFVKPLNVWQNHPELTLALQVFSSWHDKQSHACTWEVCKLPVWCYWYWCHSSWNFLCSLWLLVDKQHMIFVVRLSLNATECRLSAVFMGGGKGSIVQDSHPVGFSSVGNQCARWMMRRLGVWHSPLLALSIEHWI